jgi:DNA invertase Pin-like site-specific DNA recombinase
MGGTGMAGVRRRVRLQATALATRFSRDSKRLAPPEVAVDPPAGSARRAIGYTCLTGDADGDRRKRAAAISAGCDEHGLELESLVYDVEYGGLERRPVLVWALEQLANERAEVLVVPRLRDLSANVADLAPLLRWFDSDRRTLIALDLQLDTSAEAGRIAAVAIAGVGSWELDRISARMERGRTPARPRSGAQGRTAVTDVPELHERIAAMREQGMTLQAIADVLNEEGVPTLRGGALWRPSSVQRATGYRRPSAGGRGIAVPELKPPER